MKTIIDRFGILAFINMAIVFLLSCLVLLGWFFFDSPIKNMFPGNLLSNPVTSLCFLISSISFAMINQKLKPIRRWGKILAMLVILIALIKLVEITFSFQTGIDNWLFADKLPLLGYDGKPNAMALNTAVTLVFTGTALALSRYKIKRGNVLADYFALAVTLISAVSLIGYLYQAMEFYRAKVSMPMAFPTALSFLCISIAILLRRSAFGFFSLFTTKYQGSKTARYLVPFAILIPLVTGCLLLYGEQTGVFSPGLGVAMFAVSNIVLFLFVIWLNVLSINQASMELEAEVEVRRAAEQKMSENQQLLMDLYDNAPTGYYSIDGSGKFVNVNNKTLEWLGYSRDELIGRPITDFLPPEFKTLFEKNYPIFLKTGFLKDIEFTYIKKDGTLIPLLLNSSAVKNEAGEFLYSRSNIFDISEIKKAEKKISENEKRLQTFFKAGPDAIIVINERNKILEWNPKAESIFGFIAEEAIGRHVYELIIPPKYREAHKNGVKRYLKSDDGSILNRTVEITALHKNGHEFFVNFSISNVKIGKEWIFIAFIADITERRKLEQEVRQTNIFLNSVLENIPHMVFVKEAKNLEFVRLNKAGEDLIGLKQSELLGKTDYDFFPKESADFFTDMDRSVLKNLKRLDIKEEIIQTPHGERWLHTKKIPITDDDGLPIYLLGVSEDITEQKKIQSHLKESNEKFLRLFYSSPLSMMITEMASGFILDVNDEYERVFGFKKDELIGKTMFEAGLVKSPELGIEIRKKIAEGMSLKNLEAVIYNAAEQPIHVIASVESMKLHKQDCVISALIDNTERKKLEEDLKYINQELESFTYSVSHDLRAPLRIINGYAQIIKDDIGSTIEPDSNRMLENIIQSAKQMGTLIDDLLNFSKQGRRELVTHNTNMNALVDTVLKEQLKRDSKYKVTVKDLPTSFCDSSLMKQVWENLISNALKYSAGKTQPIIEIGAMKENGQDIYYVKDNGAGFDMKYYDKLFTVFQRLHKGNEFEGTGVGLALAQRIIIKHGGKIWAESVLQEGSTFYFTVH